MAAMSEKAHQNAPAQPAKFSLRAAMPKTAQWVDARRAELGEDYVNACIKKALAGEAGQFYAVEAGHVLGKPFAWSESHQKMISDSLACGAPFFAAIRPLDPKKD